ncbi:hypothetical protein [Sorangium sp. So ce385]|uniref:hypothetical protein n=1 Tax=Sorangium sp. So ce385 TaxID=3133308 RepID=UPI003F5AEFF4
MQLAREGLDLLADLGVDDEFATVDLAISADNSWRSNGMASRERRRAVDTTDA